MEIQDLIEQDFKQALKGKDKIAISTLRMLKAALHNKEIEKRGKKLTEEEIIKVITKQAQLRQDAIEQFTKGQREDLVEKETQELNVLKRYLPEPISAEKITEVVKKIIADTGAFGKTDFGKIMKLAMAELKGRADGKLVSKIVSTQLSHDGDDKERS